MRILTMKYKHDDVNFQTEGQADDVDISPIRELFEKMGNENSYEQIPGKKEKLDEYLQKVAEFSRAYEVDMTVDTSMFGIEVRLGFNDCAMPEKMTEMFGNLVAASDKLCIWTKLKNQEYDCIFTLDYDTHRLKK